MTSQIIATIANVALALSVVVALVFGLAQVKGVERDRRERLTVETLRNFQSREFAELIYYVLNGTVPATREEMNKLPMAQQVAFIQLGQQMESLGILVADGLIDITLVDKTLGSFVISSWNRYKGVVMGIRERDPYLNEYFQWLAERLDHQLKNDPRPPAYKVKR